MTRTEHPAAGAMPVEVIDAGGAAGAVDVSILIAVYNGEATLERAVASALASRGCRIEVIVIDDASRDGTAALLARLGRAHPGQLRALSMAQNAGPAAARNRGLDVARGRYVAVLDADDFISADRIAQLLAQAEAGGWDFVADDMWKVDEGAEDGPRTRLLGHPETGAETIDLARFVRGNMLDPDSPRGEMGFLKPLMSAEFLRRHRLRYDAAMRLGEDYALYAEALVRGARFALVPPLGYWAVVRPGSLSGHHSTRALAALVAADSRLLTRAGLSDPARKLIVAHRIESKKRWAWMRLIDAVKSRNAGEILRCFLVPPAVIWHLLGQLSEQAVLRTLRRLSLAR